MKPKKIRCWNIGDTRRGNYSIGAHSKAHAVRLLNEATKSRGYTIHYFSDFASECWGNNMAGIEPAVGVWFTDRHREKTEKIL